MLTVLALCLAAAPASADIKALTDASACRARVAMVVDTPPRDSVDTSDRAKAPAKDDAIKVKVFGQFSTLLVNSNSRPWPSGGPLYMLPLSDVSTFDLHARQSGIGAILTGPEVFGLATGAYAQVFIWNDNLSSDSYGLLPFNFYVTLTNEKVRISLGLNRDIFNPLAPTNVSLLNLFSSGNAGAFATMARLDLSLKRSSGSDITATLGFRDAVSTTVQDNGTLLDDNGWPNIEGQMTFNLGVARARAGGRMSRPLSIIVSGVVGQLRNTLVLDPLQQGVIDVRGLGVGAEVALGQRIGLVGEFFVGQGLGEYNGHIGQSFNAETLEPIKGAGGFAELQFYPSEVVHLHGGFGLDAPDRSRLGSLQRARNHTFFANAFWEVSKTVQLGAELQQRETEWIDLPNGEGLVILSQFLYRF